MNKKLKYLLIGFTALSMSIGVGSMVACTGNKDPNKGDDGKQEETIKYTITLVVNKEEKFQADAGSKLTKPKDPVRAGYKFVGWFIGDSDDEYDWDAPVEGDITIKARFEDDESIRHTVPFGAADKTESGYKTTQGNTLILSKDKFSVGTLTATVKPVKANDCGIIFGAASADGAADWEGFNYYTVLVNKSGVLLFASIPWTEQVPGVGISGFAADKEYTITVKYNAQDKYVEIWLDGNKVMTKTNFELFGGGIGLRAASDGVEFGELTVDATDIPEAPEAVDTVTEGNGHKALVGKFVLDGESAIKTHEGTVIAVRDQEQGNVVSYTMTAGAGDNGIAFALSDTEGAVYPEGAGSSYYWFFMTGNEARLARMVGGWNQVKTAMVTAADTYKLEAAIIGNTVVCMVNDVVAFTYEDENVLTGTSYGICAKGQGIGFTENTVNKALALVNGEVILVDLNTALTEPADPVRDGYIFGGWYAAGSDTEYDWSTPVTGNIIITAKWKEDTTAQFTTPSGSARLENGVYTTTQTTGGALIATKQNFSEGSVIATVKPGTKNDCGIIFGLNDGDNTNYWENETGVGYFTVLINTNGTILFAKVNGWGVMASSPILEAGGFDPTATYTLKVLYTDGYARVYAKGGNVAEFTLATTVYIGELKGTGLGLRSAAAGVEFSEFTVDANDKLTVPNAITDIDLNDQRVGSATKNDDGVYETTGNGTNDILLLSDVTLSEKGGCISVKMKRVDGDTGLIFAFTGTEDWEGSNTYYLCFIDNNGSVRGAKLPWEQYAEVGSAVDPSAEHVLTVSYDGNGVAFLVDGVLYCAFDGAKLNGVKFGVRGKGGATFSDWSVVDYSQITDNTLTTGNNE